MAAAGLAQRRITEGVVFVQVAAVRAEPVGNSEFTLEQCCFRIRQIVRISISRVRAHMGTRLLPYSTGQPHLSGGAALVQLQQARGTDARLQLREALAALAHPDLQQQSVFAAETLLHQATGPVLDFFLTEIFQRLSDCPRNGRRLRYRCAATSATSAAATSSLCSATM